MAVETGAPTKNAKLISWVGEVAALTQPESIHWCDGTSNFFGSIFVLIRIRSNVVSSTVSPATARLMRNGHFTPLTSRKSP